MDIKIRKRFQNFNKTIYAFGYKKSKCFCSKKSYTLKNEKRKASMPLNFLPAKLLHFSSAIIYFKLLKKLLPNAGAVTPKFSATVAAMSANVSRSGNCSPCANFGE